MTLYVYPSWDFAQIGTMQFDFTDTSGTYAANTFTSGVYAHVDYSTVVSTVSPFAAALKALMDAAGRTFTVTYTAATRMYTITVDSGAWSLANMNAVTQHVLGFTSASASSTGSPGVITSTCAAYYAIAGTEGAQTEVAEYEPGDLADVAEGDDGSSAMVARSAAPVYYDATIPFEPKAIVYTHHVAAANPWTWQMFFAHIRTGHHHFAMVDSGSGETTVHRLRKDGTSFAPEPVTGDRSYQEYLHIPLRTYMIGRV